jgi:hypothetical protein
LLPHAGPGNGAGVLDSTPNDKKKWSPPGAGFLITTGTEALIAGLDEAETSAGYQCR